MKDRRNIWSKVKCLSIAGSENILWKVKCFWSLRDRRNILSKVNVWVLQELKTLYCLSVIWSENIVSKVKCFRSVKDPRNIWSKVKCLSIAGAVKRQPFGTLPVIRPVSLPPTLHYFSPKHFLKCFIKYATNLNQ